MIIKLPHPITVSSKRRDHSVFFRRSPAMPYDERIKSDRWATVLFAFISFIAIMLVYFLVYMN